MNEVITAVAAVTRAETPALAAIASYEFGQSRKPLDQLASMVVSAVDTPQQQPLAQALAEFLGSSATLEAKRFVCRQLAILGTEAQVDTIAAFLLDDTLSDMARYALQPIAGDAADKALIDALNASPSESIAIGIATTLGARGSEEAVGPLKTVASAKPANAARAAIAALGRIGTPRATKALLSLKSRVAPEHTRDVSLALLRCAENLQAAGKTDKAEDIYESLIEPGESDAVRKAAFLGLVQCGGLDGAPETWRARIDEDPVLREAAAGYLRTVADRFNSLAEQQTAR